MALPGSTGFLSSQLVCHHDHASELVQSLPTAFGLTNMRAGVGGFAIGCALISAVCLSSRERLRLGLWFVVGILAPVLLVRLYGVAVDNTLDQSGRILLPESLLLSLSVAALFIGRPRPQESHGEASL